MTLRPEFVRFLVIGTPISLGVLAIVTIITVTAMTWSWMMFLLSWFGTFLLNFIMIGFMTGTPWVVLFGGSYVLHALLHEHVFRNDRPEDLVRIERFNDRLAHMAVVTGLFMALFVCFPQTIASCIMTAKLSDLSEEFLRTSSCPGYSVQADDQLIEKRNAILKTYGFTILNTWRVVNPGFGECDISARGPYIWTIWSHQ